MKEQQQPSRLSVLKDLVNRCQCILFSVVFTPPPPSHHGIVWLLPVHCIASAGLPIHVIGEVSWEPKRRRAWASQYSILSGFSPLTNLYPNPLSPFHSLSNLYPLCEQHLQYVPYQTFFLQHFAFPRLFHHILFLPTAVPLPLFLYISSPSNFFPFIFLCLSFSFSADRMDILTIKLYRHQSKKSLSKKIDLKGL